jgi:hypothetical protein
MQKHAEVMRTLKDRSRLHPRKFPNTPHAGAERRVGHCSDSSAVSPRRPGLGALPLVSAKTRSGNPGRRGDEASANSGVFPRRSAPAWGVFGLCLGISTERCFRALVTVALVTTFSILLATTQTGCLLWRQHPAATQPATAIDPNTVKPSYWLDQPAVAHIRARSFEALWDACRSAAQADGFLIDRRDYREGVLTTLPLLSKQVYEFWRGDVITPHDLTQSSLGMLRRTVRFDITRQPDGSFEASPKVLVERDSLIERRITSVDQYQNVFAVQVQDVARETQISGQDVPAEYWYPIGRDRDLEKQLARAAQEQVR